MPTILTSVSQTYINIICLSVSWTYCYLFDSLVDRNFFTLYLQYKSNLCLTSGLVKARSVLINLFNCKLNRELPFRLSCKPGLFFLDSNVNRAFTYHCDQCKLDLQLPFQCSVKQSYVYNFCRSCKPNLCLPFFYSSVDQTYVDDFEYSLSQTYMNIFILV